MDSRRWLRIALLASILLPVMFFGVVSWETYKSVYHDADTDILGTLQLLEAQSAKVIEVSELSIALVDSSIRDMSWEQISSSASLHKQMAEIANRSPDITSIVIARPDGTVAASNIAVDHAISIADRHHFVALRDGTTKEYFVPRYTGRISGDHQFSVAMRRSSPEGKFDGVIVVSSRTTLFQSLFRDALVPYSSMVLARSDAQVLASIPTQAMLPSTMFDQVTSNVASFSTVQFGGVDHRGAFERVGHYPLVVGYMLTNASITNQWVTDTMKNGGGVALGVGAVIFVIIIATRAVRRENHVRELLHEAGYKMYRTQRMEALGQITAGVAHDFNNMMAAISGNTELILAGLDANARCEAIQRAVQRGTALVGQLLSFARRQMVNPEFFDLHEVLHEMEPIIKAGLEETIRFEIVTAAAATCMLDRAELRLAVMNIVTNARQAMPLGGEFQIASSPTLVNEASILELLPGAYTRIKFTDTGIGMPEQVVQRAFEPFYTTKPVGQGTGLGLCQVYGFCRQAGGVATIQSVVSEGTTIAMYLPHVPSKPLVRPQGAKRTVLVVEDTDDLRLLVVDLLREAGWEACSASTSQEALDILKERGSDIALLLTDVMIPGGMSGLDLATRAAESYPRIRVLLMTGYAEVRGTVLPLLRKPFRAKELIAAVNAVMNEGGGRWTLGPR